MSTSVLDLNEVNVTLENAEIFGSVRAVWKGGSVSSNWRCCSNTPVWLFAAVCIYGDEAGS